MASVVHLTDEEKGTQQQVHKVGIPSKQNLFKEFKATVKETLFADDPLRPFKHQSPSRKFVLGVQAIFPIFEWGASYDFRKFRGDLIAGLTIASLCIPQVKKANRFSPNEYWNQFVSSFMLVIVTLMQDIGYAKLANLPPQYGLCKKRINFVQIILSNLL